MSAEELRQAAERLRGDSFDLMDPTIAVALADWLEISASAWGAEHKRGLSGCRLCTMKRPNGNGPCTACAAEGLARLINGGAS